MICRVRSMQAEDIPQLVDIDREAFPTQWPPTPFKKELKSRLIRYVVAYEGKKDEEHITQAETEEKSTLKEPPKGGFHKVMSRVKQLFLVEPLPPRETPRVNNQRVVGYASLWLLLDESHLTSIAVREDCRQQGIGELLLICIIDLSVQLNAQVVTLEVRVSNLSAQALYEKYGFAKVGIRRRYYSDNGEDALIMTTDCITSASYQEKFRMLKQGYFEKWGESRGPLS